MATLDFWFDYSCPYAYLASTQIEALAAQAGAHIVWKPMLLGGVFSAIGAPQILPLSPQKARYLLVDQLRWADVYGVELRHPPQHPRRTVSALRATLARANEPAIIHAFYRAYWVEGRAIEDIDVVREIAGDCDLESQREPLRRNTGEAVALGIFGAPAIVVNGSMFWGNDRLEMVASALTAANAMVT